MRTLKQGRRRLLIVVAALMWAAPHAAIALPPPPAKSPTTRPGWAKVQSTVNAYFAALPGHQAADIISRKQVEPLLGKLAAMGWKVPDPTGLLAKIPDDSSWLVTNLRTPKGTKFMRQIAQYPQGYDTTDRLTGIPNGKGIVSALIQGPGGSELIQSLTTSQTGRGTAKQLMEVPGGVDFKKPTGKLYTADALVGELTRLYSGAAKPNR